MTWNLLHLARMLKDAGGIPAHGNQRSEWDAGCRFDLDDDPLGAAVLRVVPGDELRLGGAAVHGEWAAGGVLEDAPFASEVGYDVEHRHVAKRCHRRRGNRSTIHIPATGQRRGGGYGRRSDAAHFTQSTLSGIARRRAARNLLAAAVAGPVGAFVELGDRPLGAGQARFERAADADVGQPADRLRGAVPDPLAEALRGAELRALAQATATRSCVLCRRASSSCRIASRSHGVASSGARCGYASSSVVVRS